MNRTQQKRIDCVIRIVYYIIFAPIVLLYAFSCTLKCVMELLFEKVLNQLYYKVCKIIRGPIPNSTVHILDEESKIYADGWQPGWRRVNDELLTIKDAKALGKEYEDKGYKVDLSLSEF